MSIFRIAVLTFATCYSLSVAAQAPTAGAEDLDVTMQIIVDPDAKLPDEVVRRIPLPEQRGPAKPPERKPEPATKDTKQASREVGKEAAAGARESARQAREEAKEQREEAREAAKDAKEKGKDKKDKDKD